MTNTDHIHTALRMLEFGIVKCARNLILDACEYAAKNVDWNAATPEEITKWNVFQKQAQQLMVAMQDAHRQLNYKKPRRFF